MSPLSLRRAALGALAAAALGAASSAGAAHASPFAKGPDPTAASLAQPNGPYATRLTALPDGRTPGFGPAWIYAPQAPAGETFGGVAISPGFLADGQTLTWLARRLASQGFVTIVFTPHSVIEQPPARARQLLAALDYLTTTSAVKSLVDPARLAVVGHSMGGGAALDAATRRLTLKASVAIMPWHRKKAFRETASPTLVIGSKPDWIAPVAYHARPFYRSLAPELPKAYFETTTDHAAPILPQADVSRATTSWLKRFVDDDERYTAALCPAVVGVPAGKVTRYESSCGTGPLAGPAPAAN